jgi:hypothetical protein
VLERKLLTSVADYLFREYEFHIDYDYPTFGDVKKCLGFHKESNVYDRFAKKNYPMKKKLKSGKSGYVCRHDTKIPMEALYTETQWIYLVNLNIDSNKANHQKLMAGGDGIVKIVLDPAHYDKELVEDICSRSGFAINKLDIKNSDSLTGSEASSKKTTPESDTPPNVTI